MGTRRSAERARFTVFSAPNASIKSTGVSTVPKILLGFGATKGALSRSTLLIVLPCHYFRISQPASPCARRSRPVEAFVLASPDREMPQLENGILPPVRGTADLSAIALPGLCVALEAL